MLGATQAASLCWKWEKLGTGKMQQVGLVSAGSTEAQARLV